MKGNASTPFNCVCVCAGKPYFKEASAKREIESLEGIYEQKLTTFIDKEACSSLKVRKVSSHGNRRLRENAMPVILLLLRSGQKAPPTMVAGLV